MAKIAIDIRLIGKQRTGDETVFFELTRELVEHHPEHQYVLVTDAEESELPTLKKRLGLTQGKAGVELISFGPANRFWWNAVTLPLFLAKRRDIQVFHTQYILPFWVPARIRVVAHIHDLSFVRYPEYIGWKDRLFLRSLIPHTVRRAYLAVPSEFTKQEIVTVYKVPKERIQVVPNAVSSDFEAMAEQATVDQVHAVKKKYNLPSEYLLYVGTLQPRKNIPYALEAFALLRAEHQETKNMKFVLVGNRHAHHFDPLIDATIERLGLSEFVISPGYIEAADLPLVYQGAKAFIFPSLYEGFGIPIREALAVGVPVAASDIPPHREIGGAEVRYFPLDDVAKTAEIFYSTTIIERGNSQNSHYSWRRSASLLADFYEKISS